MDLLSVTVVILSRGREEILARTLAYWAEVNISVLVLHNTRNPLDRKSLGANIEYHELQVSYGERCGNVFKYLKTEFAILSADDEIFLPSSISQMKKVLENDTDLTSIGGLTIAIGKYGPIETGTHSYASMKNYTNESKNNYERLQHHFNKTTGYRNGGIYRLMRSELMTKLMKIFSEVANFSTPYIYEITGEIFVNSYGPSKYLNNIYWIRNWINEPVSHGNWNRKLYFDNWVKDPKYFGEVNNWNHILRRSLNISEVEYMRLMEEIIELRRISEAKEILSLSRKPFPLSHNLKWLIRRLISPSTLPRSFEQTLGTMEASGAIFNELEITHAKSFLT